MLRRPPVAYAAVSMHVAAQETKKASADDELSEETQSFLKFENAIFDTLIKHRADFSAVNPVTKKR
jgi:hypothetical protein